MATEDAGCRTRRYDRGIRAVRSVEDPVSCDRNAKAGGDAADRPARGPGATHDHADSLKDLASERRAVIHDDQIGNGKSAHLREKTADFWTVQFFIEEPANLIAHFGIETHDIFGQSWGGMLASEFAVAQPAGLRRVVIADSPADMTTWVAEANRLRLSLPVDVQETLTKHESENPTGSPEYEAAVMRFYARHVCRIEPMPVEVKRSFDAIADDPTVYGTMNGPSEFHVIGSLKHWTVVDRLHQIRVPVLLISGRHDEATPKCVAPYLDRIENVRWHVFGNSSHMPHLEEKDECLELVAAFLDTKTIQERESL